MHLWLDSSRYQRKGRKLDWLSRQHAAFDEAFRSFPVPEPSHSLLGWPATGQVLVLRNLGREMKLDPDTEIVRQRGVSLSGEKLW